MEREIFIHSSRGYCFLPLEATRVSVLTRQNQNFTNYVSKTLTLSEAVLQTAQKCREQY
jgi:hypothetical protein